MLKKIRKVGFFRELFGYVRLEMYSENADYIIGQLLCELCEDIFDIKRRDENVVEFSCTRGKTAKVKDIAKRMDFDITVLESKNALWKLPLASKRPGIAVGVIVSIVLWLLSEKLVWEIRVNGNSEVTSEEIVSVLEQNGFGEGVYYPSVDLESLYRRVLVTEKRLSWISVNIKGTVAMVEVREAQKVPTKTDYDAKVNLVAARDGKVVRIDVLYGGKEVKNGEYVTKGQLLVSPFFSSRVSGPVMQSAIGKVYALTERVFDVKLPKKIHTKVYTGKGVKDVHFKILGKSIGLNKITDIPYDKYDMECKIDKVKVCGKVTLPIQMKVREFDEYLIDTTEQTEAQLEKMAYDEIYKMIGAELSDAEILELHFENEQNDDFYTLRCRAEVIENIATPAALAVEE